jgi:hypothetical protein
MSATCGAPGSRTPPAAVKQLAAGRQHTCARLVDGSVWCWGARGQTLVDGDVLGPVACPVATRVDDLGSAEDLLAVGGDACVARKDGSVSCGSLEPWSFAERPGLRGARRLALLRNELCAITGDGKLRCSRDAITAEAAAFASVEQVAMLAGGHPCALASGAVTCRYPGRDALAADIAAIASDAAGVVAITRDGSLVRLDVCRAQTPGTLCRSPLTSSIRDVTSVASSGLHTCALERNGRVSCRRCTEPTCANTAFAEISSVQATQIAVGPDHACAVLRSGEVACWGKSRCGEAGGSVPAGAACRDQRPPLAMTPILWARPTDHR